MLFSDRGRAAEVRVRSQTSGGQSGSGADVVPSSYVLLCQYQATNVSIPINSNGSNTISASHSIIKHTLKIQMGLNGAFPDDSTVFKHNVTFKASPDCVVSRHTEHSPVHYRSKRKIPSRDVCISV